MSAREIAALVTLVALGLNLLTVWPQVTAVVAAIAAFVWAGLIVARKS